MTTQGFINHIGLVLDASGSMQGRTDEVVKVVKGLVETLAERSKELDQETRLTVYLFNVDIECVFFDMDVLRVREKFALLQQRYIAMSQTALIDATMQSITDLEDTSTLHGNHAFLLYVLTDGFENASRKYRSNQLAQKLNALPNNWTLAAMVPDHTSLSETKKCGFLPNNIALWSTTTHGIVEVGETIRRTTDTFMRGRSQGVHSYSNLFSIDENALQQKVIASTLTKLDPSSYTVLNVPHDVPIANFVSSQLGHYRIGSTFYELTKNETIQSSKNIIVHDKNSGHFYTGSEARNLLGLPPYEVRVRPLDHHDYEIFVQSTSPNRKLIRGTKAVVLR